MEKDKQSEADYKQVRREYLKKWRANNRDKVREYNKRYWQKKAEEAGES